MTTLFSDHFNIFFVFIVVLEIFNLYDDIYKYIEKFMKNKRNIGEHINIDGASMMAQMVKNLPAMQETWVQSLSQEDSLEKRMATHSRILAWRIPWREEPGRQQFIGLQRVRHDWVIKHSTAALYGKSLLTSG